MQTKHSNLVLWPGKLTETPVNSLLTIADAPWMDYGSDAPPPQPSRPIPNTDSSPHSQPLKSWQNDDLQRQVSIIAGVAIAMTAGTFTQVANQAPEYEGSFDIAVQPAPQPAPTVSSSTAQMVAPPDRIVERQPDRLSDTQLKILESPKLIDPIVQQLGNIDYHTLVEHLDITVEAGDRLQVRYRDSDPERAQRVLDHLADAYLAYSQACRTGSCQGVRYIEAQIPKLQQTIRDIRTQTEQFRQKNGINNINTQLHLFTARSNEIAKQEADVQGKLAKAQQQYQGLQQQMSMQPDQAIAVELLNQDATYRQLFAQYQTINQQLAVEFSRLDAAAPKLQALYGQHQLVLNQLYAESQQVLNRYISNPTTNLRDPIFQQPNYLMMLQQSINTVNYIQILQVRQQMVGQSQSLLSQERDRLATLLHREETLQQKLESETALLQQYFQQLDTLKAQVILPDTQWQLVEQPTLATDITGQPQQIIPDLQRNLGAGAVLGILLGIGAVVAMEKRRSIQSAYLSEIPSISELQADFGNHSHLPMDIISSKAKHLADTSLRERFTLGTAA